MKLGLEHPHDILHILSLLSSPVIELGFLAILFLDVWSDFLHWPARFCAAILISISLKVKLQKHTVFGNILQSQTVK